MTILLKWPGRQIISTKVFRVTSEIFKIKGNHEIQPSYDFRDFLSKMTILKLKKSRFQADHVY